jgi:hypothetical protein
VADLFLEKSSHELPWQELSDNIDKFVDEYRRFRSEWDRESLKVPLRCRLMIDRAFWLLQSAQTTVERLEGEKIIQQFMESTDAEEGDTGR